MADQREIARKAVDEQRDLIDAFQEILRLRKAGFSGNYILEFEGGIITHRWQPGEEGDGR